MRSKASNLLKAQIRRGFEKSGVGEAGAEINGERKDVKNEDVTDCVRYLEA